MRRGTPVIIEMENVRPIPDDPGTTDSLIIIAQGGLITTRKVTCGVVAPISEHVVEHDLDAELAEHIARLTGIGFRVVD